MPEDVRYAAPVARIRAWEARLLDRATIDRLLDAPDGEATLRVLGATHYSHVLGSVARAEDFEALLQQDEARTAGFIKELCQDEELAQLIFLRYDLHNLKILLKEKFLGRLPSGKEGGEDELGGILFDWAWVPAGEMRKAVREGSYGELPPLLQEALREGEEVLRETSDLRAVDIALDRFLGKSFCPEAMAFPFGEEVGQVFADLTNIGTFLRVKLLGEDQEFLEKMLLGGGGIEPGFFREVFPGGRASLREKLRVTAYSSLGDTLSGRLSDEDICSEWEKDASNFLIDFLQKARYVALGPEPILAYFLKKDKETQALRTIMRGKLNGLPPEEIRTRLPQVT